MVTTDLMDLGEHAVSADPTGPDQIEDAASVEDVAALDQPSCDAFDLGEIDDFIFL